MRTLYEERSRKGLGHLQLSRGVVGYWEKGEVELDAVAVDENQRTLRLVMCKRSAEKLSSSHFRAYDGHVAAFMKSHPFYRSWKLERCATAPRLGAEHRAVAREAGYLAEDLDDLCAGL